VLRFSAASRGPHTQGTLSEDPFALSRLAGALLQETSRERACASTRQGTVKQNQTGKELGKSQISRRTPALAWDVRFIYLFIYTGHVWPVCFLSFFYTGPGTGAH